jgi:hypothetical protein
MMMLMLVKLNDFPTLISIKKWHKAGDISKTNVKAYYVQDVIYYISISTKIKNLLLKIN